MTHLKTRILLQAMKKLVCGFWAKERNRLEKKKIVKEKNKILLEFRPKMKFPFRYYGNMIHLSNN